MGEATKLLYYRQQGSFVEPGRNVRIADNPGNSVNRLFASACSDAYRENHGLASLSEIRVPVENDAPHTGLMLRGLFE